MYRSLQSISEMAVSSHEPVPRFPALGRAHRQHRDGWHGRTNAALIAAPAAAYDHKKRTGLRRKQTDPTKIKERIDERLRIVPQNLWDAVQKRRAEMNAKYLRSTDGQLFGRPSKGANSRFLLTGIAVCGCCEGTIGAIGGTTGSGASRRPEHRYGCTYRINRGATVCSNVVRLRMQEVDQAIIARVRSTALSPERVERIIAVAANRLAEQR
jgi:hypothetical protein